MRSDMSVDQAEGLRRLLVSTQTRVVTVVAGKAGVGRTCTTINLAAALAHAGKDVLILDENHAPNNSLDRLGLRARHDLLDVVLGRCKSGAAVLGTEDFSVLPGASAMHALPDLNKEEQQRLESALIEVSRGVDVMLVDAAMHDGQATVSSSMASGATLLVVVDGTASGITESYALIKRLALEKAQSQFEILVNNVASERAARTVFDNMAKVAQNKLATRLEYLGYVPKDEQLVRATYSCRSVLDAYPASASAKAYLGLAHKLMRLPAHQDEAEGGISQMMKSLISQLSRQPAGEIVRVAS